MNKNREHITKNDMLPESLSGNQPVLQVNNSSIDENAHNSVYQSQKKMEELINGCKEVWRIYF